MTFVPVFKLPHLSEDAVAAFADGVLSATATSRAQRHCDECPECAAAVRGQREAAMMLRSATTPCAPSGLLDRLACLPMSVPLPSRGMPTGMSADGMPVISSEHAVPDTGDDDTDRGGRGRMSQFRMRGTFSGGFPSSQSRP